MTSSSHHGALPSPGLRLFLVRHGQVPANREFRFIGSTDERLSAEGELEADNLGTAFAQIPVDAVFSSPRIRALETARRISPAPRVVEELAEQDFGEWEGLTREEVGALGVQHEQHLSRFLSDPRVRPPEGESGVELSERLDQFLSRLVSAGHDRAVLVSHVGPIKAILALAMGLEAGKAAPMFLDTGTVSVVEWGERRFVRLFNCRGALGWQTARWMDH